MGVGWIFIFLAGAAGIVLGCVCGGGGEGRGGEGEGKAGDVLDVGR